MISYVGHKRQELLRNKHKKNQNDKLSFVEIKKNSAL